MQSAFYFIGIIGFLIDCIYFGLKCIEWNQKRIADKYQTNQHHFISDLARLEVKWYEAGEIGYAETCRNAILFTAKATKDAEPSQISNEAASRELNIWKNRKEELLKEIKEDLEAKQDL